MEERIDMPAWQAASLCGLLGWAVLSSALGLGGRLRSLVQPWVCRRVAADVPLILRVQSFRNGFLDAVFTALSCLVSVPFYTGFLPLVFWSGHSKLARQLTLLMAFSNYCGNAIKDLVSAPRPISPPVRRVTAIDVEKEHAMEYGLPSSHAMNTASMFGYMLYYALSDNSQVDLSLILGGSALVLSLILLTGIARIYLGMHSVIDVIAGVIGGMLVLAFWLAIHEYLDGFITFGQNVTSYWAALAFLLCVAYPFPQLPTPSFDYHMAFNGVSFGIVCGVHQTFHQFHHNDVPHLLTPRLTLTAYAARVLIGIPGILLAKFCSKALAKWVLPMVCSALCVPVKSTCYVSALKEVKDGGNDGKPDARQSGGYVHKLVAFLPLEAPYDVDTGIRFFQYAGLAWSVVDLVPSIFQRLGL